MAGIIPPARKGGLLKHTKSRMRSPAPKEEGRKDKETGRSAKKVGEVKENPVTCGWSAEEESQRGTRAGGAVDHRHEDLIVSDHGDGDDDLVGDGGGGVVVGRVFGDGFGGQRILLLLLLLRRWSGHAALPRG